MTAFFFYFLVNIQGAFEALQPFNKLTHFTNFVVAHAHLALLGAFTILGMGVIDYMVAQIYQRPLWSRSLTEWQYWLVTVGFTGFFSVLTLAGFQQGFSWEQGIPEVNVLPQLHAYYIARGIFGAMIVVSGIVQIVNIGMTIFTEHGGAPPPRDAAASPRRSRRRWRGMSDERRARSRRRRPRPARLGAAPAASGCSSRRSIAGLGGLIAFFAVVFVVVWLPIHTFDPPPSADWAPLLERRGQGPQPVRLERLLRLPLGLLAAAGRPRRALLPLPEGLAARRLLRQRPVARTCSAPSAPGPTSRRSPAGTRTTGSARTSTTRATSTRCR